MTIWRHVDALVLHIFDMVGGVKLMPMRLTHNKELMSSRVLGAALFQFQTDSVLLAP